MTWYAALAQAGSSVLGGILGRHFAGNQASLDRRLQREFAQNSIQWRVEDAKKAGLHPLSAIGMQPSQYSPVQVQDPLPQAMSDAGQAIGRAAAAQMTPAQRRAEDLSILAMQKQIEESDARIGVLRSEAARNLQSLNASQAFPPSVDQFRDETGQLVSNPPGVLSYPLPDELNYGGPEMDRDMRLGIRTPADTHQDVGPMFRRFRFHSGEVVLPTTSDDPAEALETLGESTVLMYITYKENVKRYGQAFTDEFFQSYFEPEVWKKAKRWFKERMPGEGTYYDPDTGKFEKVLDY